jgi:putative alpha-1,2-mannosidase
MGGDAVAVDRLDQLFTAPPEVQTKVTFFGVRYPVPQYAPGNEHDIQVPWMYPFAGQPWRTQAELRELKQVFRPTPDGLPGNDDLGSLSAWWVWNALGFGPVTPGAPFFVIGSPQFERVEVHMSNGKGAKPFVIEAPGSSDLAPYVQGGPSWVRAAAVRPGGSLQRAMGPLPDRTPKAAPPSATDSSLAAFGCRGA